MRIAVVNLTAGGISGGHRRFLEELLPRLASSSEVEALLCVSPATINAKASIAPHPKMSFAECRPFSPLRASPDKAFKKTLDDFHPDVIFMSIERRLDYPGVPIAVMVQNMEPLVDLVASDGLIERLRRWARCREAGRAVKRAAAVIAPTNFVKEALIQKFSIVPEKISVINFGSVPPESEPMRPRALTLPSPRGRGINNDEKFIFTAGSMEHYRGIEDIIDALAGLKVTAHVTPAIRKPGSSDSSSVWIPASAGMTARPEQSRLMAQLKGLKLVIAGDSRPGTEAYLAGLKERAQNLGVADDIVWLGNLKSQEMSWCYLNCAACVITSRVESFCMVALEALSHGCLCVSTDSPCLPEVLGPEVNYYQAGDGKALARELSRTLSLDASARVAMSASARARAQSFSWDKSAGLIVELFKRCR